MFMWQLILVAWVQGGVTTTLRSCLPCFNGRAYCSNDQAIFIPRRRHISRASRSYVGFDCIFSLSRYLSSERRNLKQSEITRSANNGCIHKIHPQNAKSEAFCAAHSPNAPPDSKSSRNQWSSIIQAFPSQPKASIPTAPPIN